MLQQERGHGAERLRGCAMIGVVRGASSGRQAPPSRRLPKGVLLVREAPLRSTHQADAPARLSNRCRNLPMVDTGNGAIVNDQYITSTRYRCRAPVGLGWPRARRAMLAGS